jgi:acyl-coenzyme A synthetase/AMP-(fatty) acid ligase
VEFVPELPRNATGKIRRVELRHRAVAEHPVAEADRIEQAGSRRPEGAS